MKKHLLQDMRRKVTRLAYEQEILDCCHDPIIEFSSEHKKPLPDLNDIKQVSEFMLSNIFTVEYNYPNNIKRLPNIYERVTDWTKDRMTFGFETYTIAEWLVSEGLVSNEFIPHNKDLTLNMQLAAERHFQYLARTLLNNVSHETFYKLLKGA